MSTPVTTQPESVPLTSKEAPPGGEHGVVPAEGQPMIQWMPKPIVANCPPGLEYLTMVDQILVKQQVELLEAIIGFECSNKYKLLNSLGQQIYFAGEESDLCMRQCCKNARGFIIHITDNMGQEVMRVVRDFKCCAGCCWCANGGHCSLAVTVEAPVGQVVGKVIQTCSFIQPRFDITTPDDDVVMKIRGPVCLCDGPCFMYDQEFNVFQPDEVTQVGKISKQYAGFIKEMFSKADNFGITFPMDLDVKMKATMLGALFLIDFMFFEVDK